MGCGPSKQAGNDPLGKSNGNGNSRKGMIRQDSGRSNSSSKRRGGRKNLGTAATLNGGSHHNSKSAMNGKSKDATTSGRDPRWMQLWENHHRLLLDPADIHAAMESCMARVTNQLSTTEITFLQRKVRSIIRTSHSSQDKAPRIAFRSNSSNSQVQETKVIAEKHHLLTNYVIRKVLPKLPHILPLGLSLQDPSTPNDSEMHTPLSDNVYLLALYLHESLWDRVERIAITSSKLSGLEMDVNKFKLPETVPHPTDATSENIPEIPPGVSLQALTFLIALALRGSRMQRLQLLFYLLLPSDTLSTFMDKHPAGGPPLWLLEVGNDTVLSLASMSHYYWYGDTFSPVAGKSDNKNHTASVKEASGQKEELSLDGGMFIAFVKSILMPPVTTTNDGAKTPIQQQPETTTNGHKSPHQFTSPKAKTAKMRRRASNQGSEDEIYVITPKTEVIERVHDSTFALDDYVDDDMSMRDVLIAAGAPIRNESKLTMKGFFDFCQSAIDDEALDAIMHRLFAHTLLPSPTMELEMVSQRWRKWQETDCVLYTKSVEQPEGTLEVLAQSVRKVLLMQKSDSVEVSTEKKVPQTTFGGIGGFDGRGALGYGIMYCIDRKWWDAWESYVGWTWAGETSALGADLRTKRSRRRPGDLSSESLLNRLDDDMVAGTLGSYELMRRGLVKDKDYVLIPARVWDVLYEMYGGGPPLPRMVLPPQTTGANGVGATTYGTSTTVDEIQNAPSESQLDAMASTDNADRVLRIPQQMEVETHPWVLHVHLCDPQQPYRRGDAGPMSIRIMMTPDQPLWRLYAEAVVRLPFHLYRAYGPDGRGKARIWKRSDPTGTKDAMTRYGPWTLLCKNREAILPKRNTTEELDSSFQELKQNWDAFSDNASIESIGLANRNQIMVECAILNRSGAFIWPREAAAKAGRVKRLADKDMKFRNMLRGLDDADKPLDKPADLVGLSVDAMDASGKWFQVEISRVQIVAADTDEEEDSLDEGEEPTKASGESKQVLVDFGEHGGHAEWIDVESDRLASPGRFTLSSGDDAPEGNQKAIGTANGDGKPKTQTQVKKATDASEAHGKVCTIPGYGACGLANLGNTCYVNSAIQCVSYLPLLRAYLLSAQYKVTGDLNKDNPIGTGGKLLEEFAELLRQMWSAKLGEKSPTRFRSILGKENDQFSGADQQDSQEFLSYILDALHEDSNRVRKKPYVEGLEDEWVKQTSLARVGEEAWRRFLRRNRSIMADIGMGQVLNTVTCPTCNFTSHNFDPFNLLSLPFPTVADVIFKCYVVRRANCLNTPWILNRARKGSKSRTRIVRRDVVQQQPKPPSEQLAVEEYIIAMSRLADSGDLKLQIQNLTGIHAANLRLCRAEEIAVKDGKDDTVVSKQVQVSQLTDKEGPCSQFANRPRANSEDIGTAPSSPSIVVAFESTLCLRNDDEKSGKSEDSDSNSEEIGEEQDEKTGEPSVKELKELEKQVTLYGNDEECRLYDTDALPIAKALSRSLFPTKESELKLGLRVDALDHEDHFYPGSVVEILEAPADGETKESDRVKTKVKVHFDNFSSRWDQEYQIDDFTGGRVRPLHSHTTPRMKPTEFLVHHRYTDRTSRTSNLFGQSFYIQCHNEWSTARAGAQILAQASRYLKLPSEFRDGPVDVDNIDQEREARVQRLYDRTQAVISDLIDLLIDCDREYVQYALSINQNPNSPPDSKSQRYRNPGFDATALSQSLMKRVGSVLHRLPFEVRVCTIDSPLGGTNDEVAFPFSLMRTIGNYMNARHAVVLQWREPPTDKKVSSGKQVSYLGAPVMYTPSKIVADTKSAEILKKANQRKRSSSSPGSGGLQLGVCLTEFCKQQQLSNWRCPKCKDFREGKQNMALWRLPDLLTIHIKRFNCSARWREKITTKVNFPLTGLDLEEWCHYESPIVQEDASGETYVYDLIGVLNHYGGMTGGHYVATCKATACSKDGSEEVAYDFNGAGTSKAMFSDESDPDSQTGWKFGRQKSEVNKNKVVAADTARAAAESAEPLWLQFDDDLVEPIPPRYVVSQMAYVLFYRRRRMTPSNVAKYSTLE